MKSRCRSRRTLSSTRRKIAGVPIEDLVLRSVHLTVSNLPIGSEHLNQLLLTGSPNPRQLPLGRATARIRPVMRQPFGGGADTRVPGFLSPFDRRRWLLGSSCARWGGSAFLTVGLPAVDPPDPNGVVMLRMNKIRSGRAPPFTPGTVVRSRPTTTLRPAPTSQRPVPTAPLTHPIGGGHLHEASSGVHSRSPITPRWLAATPEPESETTSRRSSPRPRPPDGTAAASASTPGFAPAVTQSAPRRRQAPSRTGPGTTPSPSTKPPTGASHFTHAPSCRT